MVLYRYIGQGVTNRNGVASINYTGSGKGKMEVVASTDRPVRDGSLQSETYSIWDYLMYDKATLGNKSDDWVNSGTSVNTDENGTTLSNTETQTYTSTKILTGDFEIVWQSVEDNAIRFGLIGASDTSKIMKFISMTPYSTQFYYKIRRVNGTITVQYSTDGVSWTDRSVSTNNITNEDCKFMFSIEATSTVSRSVTYHDLKAYPI